MGKKIIRLGSIRPAQSRMPGAGNKNAKPRLQGNLCQKNKVKSGCIFDEVKKTATANRQDPLNYNFSKLK